MKSKNISGQNIGQKFKSAYIFPKPSFLNGMGSVLNIAGNYFSFKSLDNPNEVDYEAIKSDWKAVGFDLWDSTESFAKKNNFEKNV